MNRAAFFSAAVSRVRPSAVLLLTAGNLLLFVLAALLLLLPDSHVWQFVLSFLLAAVLLGGLLVCNAVVLRRIRGSATTPLWAGALILLGWLLLLWLVHHLIGLALPNVEMRAGYWNSRLSPGMRNLLTYERLIALQQGTIRALRWVIVPALLLPFTMQTVCFGISGPSVRRAARVLGIARHWIVSVVALGLAVWLTPVLADWHPTDTIHGEIVSALLRLGAAAVLDAVAVLLVFASDAELLFREEPPIVVTDAI